MIFFLSVSPYFLNFYTGMSNLEDLKIDKENLKYKITIIWF